MIPSTQELEGFSGLLLASFGQEPGGRFRHEEHGTEEEGREGRQDPGEHVPGHERPDDVSDEDAQRQEDGREGSQSSSHPRRGTLSNLYVYYIQ